MLMDSISGCYIWKDAEICSSFLLAITAFASANGELKGFPESTQGKPPEDMCRYAQILGGAYVEGGLAYV